MTIREVRADLELGVRLPCFNARAVDAGGRAAL